MSGASALKQSNVVAELDMRKMFKQTEVGLIPEDWSCTTVGDAFEICNNLRLPLSRSVRERMLGQYPYYGPTSVQGWINEYKFEGTFALIGEDGDHFLKWRTSPMTLLVDGRFNVNNHAHVVHGSTNYTAWFYWFFSNRDLTAHLTRQGASRYKLTKASLVRLPCALPPPAEQKAIATALGDADALIEGVKSLIAKKRAIKQGAMQELLTGKRRLPGFKGEWKSISFSRVAKIRNVKTNTFGNSAAAFCVELDHIGQGNGLLEGHADARDRITLKYTFCQGDVLFGRLRPYLRKFWHASRDGVCSTEIWPLVPAGDEVVAPFLNHVVRTDSFIGAASAAYGTHMPRADWKGLLDLQVPCPPTTDEQTAIADVLSDMDSEISQLEAKLAKAKQVKQGMMQELLTGRIRLV